MFSRNCREFINKIYPIIKSRSTLVKALLFIVVIIIGLNMKNILILITGSETPIAVIHGYSMFPLLREGDLVFAYKPKPEHIRIGDIIIYEGLDGRLVIHRVIEIRIVNGKYYYVTKGDNNELPDIYQFSGPGRIGIPYERVKGIVISFDHTVLKIPYLGYLSIWYHNKR